MTEYQSDPDSATTDPVPVTDDVVRTLRAHSERTGIGAVGLLNAASIPPAGLSAAVINNWLGGYTVSARRDHLEFVLQAWAELPSRIALTPKLIARMKAERRRTGVAAAALLAHADEVPEGLSANVVNAWLSGSTASALECNVDYVLSAWSALPGRVEIDPAARVEMRRHKKRTGTGPAALLKSADDVPDGLTADMIGSWLSGAARMARQDHLDYVLERWAALPERVPITEDIRDELRAHVQRTGVTARRLLSGAGEGPDGLTGQVIENWITGATRSARRDHLDYVNARWSALPHISLADRARVPVTPEIRMALQAQQKRTGTGLIRLLKGAHDVPDGLTPHMAMAWLSGRTKTARRDHLEYVLGKWQKCPAGGRARAGYVRITPEILAELQAHRERTGIGPMALLRGADDKPEGLTSTLIGSWLSGATRSARKDYLAYVLRRWRARS